MTFDKCVAQGMDTGEGGGKRGQASLAKVVLLKVTHPSQGVLQIPHD